MENREYIGVKEFAARAGVSPQAVYKRLNRDLTRFKKIQGGKIFIDLAAFEHFGNQKCIPTINPLQTENEQPGNELIAELRAEITELKETLKHERAIQARTVAMLDAASARLLELTASQEAGANEQKSSGGFFSRWKRKK